MFLGKIGLQFYLCFCLSGFVVSDMLVLFGKINKLSFFFCVLEQFK